MNSLQSILSQAESDTLSETIVNAPFSYKAEMVVMGIGIIVLLLHDPSDGQIHRIAISRTDMADDTKRISQKKFEEILIPADDPQNIIAGAIRTQSPQMTTDWQYLFTPALSGEQARLNQAAGGIACSYVYPLQFNGQDGAMIFSYFKEPNSINALERNFMEEYSRQVSKVLQNRKAVASELTRQ